MMQGGVILFAKLPKWSVQLDTVEHRFHFRGGHTSPIEPHTLRIPRVRQLPETPSISIHLLGNDLGCIWRHAFDPEAHTVSDFRSGYTNVECQD